MSLSGKNKTWSLIPRHLNTQLALLFSILLTSTIFLFTYHSVEEQANRLVTGLQNDARVLTDNLATTAADYVLERNYAAIERLALRTARFPGILRIQVTDPDGRLLTDVEHSNGLEPSAIFGQPPISVPNVNTQFVQFTEIAMLVWQPMILGDIIGWVKVTYDLVAIAETRHEYWFDNLTDGVLLIVIAVILLNLFIRKPISEIRRFTNFSSRLVEQHGDQIGINARSIELEQLGVALNNASTRLHDQSAAIKKAMKDLERLAAFAEHTPNLVVSINNTGNIVYINPRGKETLDQLQLNIHTISKLLPNDIDILVERCIGKNEILQEIEVEYNDITILWTFAPVRGQNIIHGYGVDITKRKKAEELAQVTHVEKVSAVEANRAKSRFLAVMSHELRTPLNAILGYSDLLAEEVDLEKNKSQKDVLDKIRSAGTHLLTLIDDILDLSKIEAGKMEIYIEELDTIDMIENVLLTVRPLASKNSNEIVIKKENYYPTIKTDAKKVRQVLLNLMSNACKFTQKGKIELTIATARPVGEINYIEFRVKDTGIGMNEKQMSKIFDQFSQADNSTTRKYGGTGLGLTISKHFCEMLGGSISVESSPGLGSNFTVILPIDSSRYETGSAAA